MLTSQASGDEVRIEIRWRSGASEMVVARRPPPPYGAKRTPNFGYVHLAALLATTLRKLVAQGHGFCERE